MGGLRGWANTRLPLRAGVLEPDGMPQEGLGDALESSIPLPGPRLGPLGSLGARRRQHQPTHTSPHLPRPTDTTSRTPQADPPAAIHEAPNEYLSEKTRSRREKRRPVVVGRCRSVQLGSPLAGHSQQNHFRSQARPSPLCCARSSSGAQPFCMQIPVTACHR